ncbi:S-adenosyl-L-methionine-dependent methyltransferase [Xylaria digitata]|nr:S-adenosyl-L-methionine-dependent methyltransferase [Xylaria digitata]
MEPQSFTPNTFKLAGSVDSTSLGETVVVALPSSTLTQPASYYEGFVPPVPEEAERDAVATLLESLGAHDSTIEYVEFELDYFSIYIDNTNFPNELRPLQHLVSRNVQCMYFDGVLQHGDVKFYLHRVPFHKLPVGNYGEHEHTVGDQIWILSKLNESLSREVYYKLRSPAPEYRRFHTPFLWIADLAKHVIDYCEHRRGQSRPAVLHDFKSRFSIWMMCRHRTSTAFERWYTANGSTDFRGAVIANIDYIFEEAYGLDPKIASWHHIWKEVKTLNHYQPTLRLCPASPQGKIQLGYAVPRTIVTPYVYNLFSHMVFGDLLQPKEASISVEMMKDGFIRQSQSMLSQPGGFRSAVRGSRDRTTFIANIKPGDVISTLPDDGDTTDTRWKRESSIHYDGEYRWFGLVQKVHVRPSGKRSFDVLWLYQPIDTPCSVMKYPWANELFLSDNCTCHPATAKIQEHEVLSIHEVEWFGSPSTSTEFFVRQTYVASDCRWTSLREEHLVCGNESAFSQELDPFNQYRVGDTVLVENEKLHLETFVIDSFLEKEKLQYARMRPLRRRKDVDRTACFAPPNELIYSLKLVEIACARIDRRCIVRAFRVDEEIPPPYNRNGTGDAFFVTHQEIEAGGVVEYRPLESIPFESFRQGFNSFYDKAEKLQGLDLFCGGGNFGRGIEEGGAVEMRWANDIWEGAIHSYMANTDTNRCTPFLSSVDDLLSHALEGDQKVPAPGDVHFISGGSPCPGFSALTPDRTTKHQRKNQSLVASFASFVELYRPFYGVLENVPNMVNSSRHRDSCVFSQLVCALVGLEYQVQVLFLDAWSFGSAQKRTRVFLAFTAPGLRIPKAPKASHSHPPNTPLYKLGEMSCGRPFDSRKVVPTPFKFVSMREAVGDLPDIQDGKADYCVGYPDHRLSIGYTWTMRKQLQCIPTRPYGMSFSKAWLGGVLTETERLLFPVDGKERARPGARGWGRINPTRLVGTIPTKCLPTDARIGIINHWEQNRPMTILEARRAQGFPDQEVLIGTRADQYKIIGNSVSRHVALVLGLAIREAWLGTLLDLDESAGTGLQTQSHGILDRTSMYSSEGVLTTTSTSSSLGLSTPATSESVELFDNELHHKRSRSIYVELVSKKRRCELSPDELTE